MNLLYLFKNFVFWLLYWKEAVGKQPSKQGETLRDYFKRERQNQTQRQTD